MGRRLVSGSVIGVSSRSGNLDTRTRPPTDLVYKSDSSPCEMDELLEDEGGWRRGSGIKADDCTKRFSRRQVTGFGCPEEEDHSGSAAGDNDRCR